MSLFHAFLLVIVGCGDKDEGDGTAPTGDGGVVADGGTPDGGNTDGGTADGGTTDGGTTNGGTTDGGATDGGTTDGGATDGGTTDGGTSDGGTTDGGATDGGTSGGHDLTSGVYQLTVGRLIGDTCVTGPGGDALDKGATAEVSVSVHGDAVTIDVMDDLSFTGTRTGDDVMATQVTSTYFGPLGYDCDLQYTWWIDGSLTADDRLSAELGLDYDPLSGSDCDELAAADGWLGFPCGWSVAADLERIR